MSKPKPAHTLRYYLSKIPDPRSRRGRIYPLADLLIMILFGYLCGYTNMVEITLFLNEEPIRKILHSCLKIDQVPSHDTFSRIVRLVDSSAVQQAFFSWLNNTSVPGDHIAIDGKGLRGAAQKSEGENVPYILNVYDSKNHQTVTQLIIPAKTNEISGIRSLLEEWSFEGKLVTIDAIGTQKTILSTLDEQGAKYLVPVKSNQEELMKRVTNVVEHRINDRENYPDGDVSSTERMVKDHGRIDIRKAEVVTGGEWKPTEGFGSVITAAIVTRTRQPLQKKKGKLVEASVTKVAYVSNKEMEASEILDAISDHWSIENGLHWRLDNRLDEDRNTARKGNAKEVCSCIRKTALGIMMKDHKKSGGSVTKSTIHFQTDYKSAAQYIAAKQ